MASSIPIKYFEFYYRLILPLDGTLKGNIYPAQSRTWSNGKEGVLHTPHITRTAVSQPDAS